MALNLSDVEKIAKLSRLSLTENEKTKTLSELNDIFAMVEKMQSVNTDGVEPMPHPHETALRLREDAVTETDHAAEYQAVAPAYRHLRSLRFYPSRKKSDSKLSRRSWGVSCLSDSRTYGCSHRRRSAD